MVRTKFSFQFYYIQCRVQRPPPPSERVNQNGGKAEGRDFVEDFESIKIKLAIILILSPFFLPASSKDKVVALLEWKTKRFE